MQDKIWYAIGAMSGTSLDGLDLVYVKFDTTDGYKFEILESETLQYSESWKSKLQNAFKETSQNLVDLSLDYADYLANSISTFIDENKIEKLNFIASHGHTVFHKPEQAYTLQIGDGERISKLTGYTVISDFRTQDVKLGGQGAPLVPIGDAFLFSDYEYCLNLGGFSNISFDEKGTRKAFDICPVNIVLNPLAQKLGFEYDDKGALAATGKIDKDLLKELNALFFYKDDKPKSLGYEFVVAVINPILQKYNLKPTDALRTFTEHVAQQIASKLDGKGKVLITGGGTYNTFLIERLRALTNCELVIPSKDLIDFKEALIFAFLGLRRLNNQVNCLKSVTGASKDHSSGEVFLFSFS